MSYRRPRPRAICPGCGESIAVYLSHDWSDPEHETRSRGHFAHHSRAVGEPCVETSQEFAFDISGGYDAPVCMPDEDGRSYVDRLKGAVVDALDAKTAASADLARLALEELVGR